MLSMKSEHLISVQSWKYLLIVGFPVDLPPGLTFCLPARHVLDILIIVFDPYQRSNRYIKLLLSFRINQKPHQMDFTLGQVT